MGVSPCYGRMTSGAWKCAIAQTIGLMLLQLKTQFQLILVSTTNSSSECLNNPHFERRPHPTLDKQQLPFYKAQVMPNPPPSPKQHPLKQPTNKKSGWGFQRTKAGGRGIGIRLPSLCIPMMTQTLNLSQVVSLLIPPLPTHLSPRGSTCGKSLIGRIKIEGERCNNNYQCYSNKYLTAQVLLLLSSIFLFLFFCYPSVEKLVHNLIVFQGYIKNAG